MTSAMGKIMSAVVASCRTSPLTVQLMRSACGSGISSAVTTTGPTGQNVVWDLPRNHWLSERWRSRAVTSLTLQ